MSWELARLPVRVFAGATPDSIDRSAPAAKVATGTEVTLTHPEPGAPRYFEVVPRGRRHGPVVADRSLGLESAPNARDLGGYQTVDGRSTRWGRLFRANDLSALSDVDRSGLETLGLPTTCPEPAGAGAVDDAMLTALAESVTSRAARRRDGALLRRLARDPTPQWVQCDPVADQFGWSAALVLISLGVARETVVADHLLGLQAGVTPPPNRRYLDLAIEAVRRRYQTWGRYLGEGLGLDQRTYDRLRKRYVTDP